MGPTCHVIRAISVFKITDCTQNGVSSFSTTFRHAFSGSPFIINRKPYKRALPPLFINQRDQEDLSASLMLFFPQPFPLYYALYETLSIIHLPCIQTLQIRFFDGPHSTAFWSLSFTLWPRWLSVFLGQGRGLFFPRNK